MELEPLTPRKPLRLWPGALIVAVQWLVMFGLPLVAPDQGGTAVIGGFVGGLVILLWWLFLSRASWVERLGAIVAMVVAVAATSRLVHESIANGMMGFMLFLYAAPLLSLALVVWAAASSRPVARSSTRVDGRRHAARVRYVDTGAHQWCHRRRHVRFRMAVGANGGRTTSCTRRRQLRSSPLRATRHAIPATPPARPRQRLLPQRSRASRCRRPRRPCPRRHRRKGGARSSR